MWKHLLRLKRQPPEVPATSQSKLKKVLETSKQNLKMTPEQVNQFLRDNQVNYKELMESNLPELLDTSPEHFVADLNQNLKYRKVEQLPYGRYESEKVSEYRQKRRAFGFPSTQATGFNVNPKYGADTAKEHGVPSEGDYKAFFFTDYQLPKIGNKYKDPYHHSVVSVHDSGTTRRILRTSSKRFEEGISSSEASYAAMQQIENAYLSTAQKFDAFDESEYEQFERLLIDNSISPSKENEAILFEHLEEIGAFSYYDDGAKRSMEHFEKLSVFNEYKKLAEEIIDEDDIISSSNTWQLEALSKVIINAYNEGFKTVSYKMTGFKKPPIGQKVSPLEIEARNKDKQALIFLAEKLGVKPRFSMGYMYIDLPKEPFILDEIYELEDL